MSDCERYERVISMQIDGEAGAADLAELERHLAECAACRAWQAKQLRLDAAMVRALGEWRESLRPAPPAPRPRRLARAAAAAVIAAAAAACALVAGYYWGRTSAPAPSARAAAQPPEDLGEPLPPGPYFAETEKTVPVVERLVWDPEHGLRSAKYFDKSRIYTVSAPERGIEVEWTTSDREVQLVALGEED
ncbi:MAG: zf-HC2 domain-containing protein [Planctomycetota bacterium]|jgi:hypothetical protein